jgi:hypothetical protein
MGRKKLADGKRVLLALKVSEGKAAAVDSARGELLRGQWIEKLIDAALEAEGISTAPIDRLPPQIPAVKTARRPRGKAPVAKATVPPPPPPARPVGATVFQEPGGELAVTTVPPPASERKRCLHPGTRSIGGFCPPCGHLIDTGGCWNAACEAGTCVHPK